MDMGVSKNRGTPKWMVYNGKPYEQMDDLGGNTPIFGNTHIGNFSRKIWRHVQMGKYVQFKKF